MNVFSLVFWLNSQRTNTGVAFQLTRQCKMPSCGRDSVYCAAGILLVSSYALSVKLVGVLIVHIVLVCVFCLFVYLFDVVRVYVDNDDNHGNIVSLLML